MMKDYIEVNRKTYDDMAKEYGSRNYEVKDDFYLDVMFKDMNFGKGKKILEVGPGRGARLRNFCDYGMDVTAVELSSEMCTLCRKAAPEARILNCSVFDCSFEQEFDYIYMEAMIHNFPLEDARKVLKLVHSWLKDGGTIICTTTMDEKDDEGYEAKSDYENKKERFRHRYTKESFDELFSICDFEIIDKKYKSEIDETRNKTWQIVYAKKK